jgi:hypothetical protein
MKLAEEKRRQEKRGEEVNRDCKDNREKDTLLDFLLLHKRCYPESVRWQLRSLLLIQKPSSSEPVNWFANPKVWLWCPVKAEESSVEHNGMLRNERSKNIPHFLTKAESVNQ